MVNGSARNLCYGVLLGWALTACGVTESTTDPTDTSEFRDSTEAGLARGDRNQGPDVGADAGAVDLIGATDAPPDAGRDAALGKMPDAGVETGSTSTNDGNGGFVLPASSPISDRAEELFAGPKQIACGVVNECEVGTCALDVNACEGDFEITVETDLEALGGCTSVSGDLTIAAPELSSLEPLRSLVAIGGDLALMACDGLSDLAGLDNLVSVAGDLLIGDPNRRADRGNASLVDLGGLEQLRFVGGDVVVTRNPLLKTLEGFGVRGLDHTLLLVGNDAVTSARGLSSLTCVGQLALVGNPELESLSGLENLKQLGTLHLDGNASLSNLDALQHLQWIPWRLWLTDLESLTDLSGLSGLQGVGELELYQNDLLQSFDGLDNLKVVRGNLRGTLDDFTGLGQLQVVGGSIRGAGQVSTRGLDSLEAVTLLSLDGDVELEALPPALIIGTLELRYNTITDDLRAFEAVTITDGLSLSATLLESLDGLQHPGSLLGSILLESNDELHSLEALSGLSSLEGNLLIRHNAALSDFLGLDGVEFVGGSFLVMNNAPLPSDGFTALERLTTIGGGFQVRPDFDLRLVPELESVHVLDLYELAITDLTPFADITVTGGLTLFKSSTLLSLDGFHHDGTFDGDLELAATELLTDLGALRGLRSAGRVMIAGNDGLTDLTGLDDLESTSGPLAIRDNEQLRTLAGLDALTSVGAGLDITGNPALDNLDGLAQLTTITDGPEGAISFGWIYDNPTLPQCTADAFLQRLVGLEQVESYGNDEAAVCE